MKMFVMDKSACRFALALYYFYNPLHFDLMFGVSVRFTYNAKYVILFKYIYIFLSIKLIYKNSCLRSNHCY